jgi:hypothetical protein
MPDPPMPQKNQGWAVSAPSGADAMWAMAQGHYSNR